MKNTELNELTNLLSLELDDLYCQLLPKDDATVYSKNGAVAKGKEIFRRLLPELADKICRTYNDNETTSTNLLDLAVLITSAISGLITVANVPIMPLSAIIVKIGLERLCQES